MKWLLVLVLGLGVLVAIVAIIGTQLPQNHSATRRAEFAVPPDAVWRAITDVQAFPSWRSGIKSVSKLPDRNGRTTWVEESRSGRMTLTVDQSDPPRRLVLRIADPDLPFGGTWTYDIAPVAGGSSLTITENGEIYNPLFRFMARFVFGYEATMTSYLASLEKHFGARG